MLLKDKIPTLYHILFTSILELEFVEEKIANCENCNLCHSSKSPYINTKCCSYHPHMSNYLIGGILAHEDKKIETGQLQIKKRIETKFGVTPYGIIPTSAYVTTDRKLKANEFWERAQGLLERQVCPYLANGKCSIWKFRENLCVTYFCSSVSGKSGTKFWSKVNEYIKMAETTLAQYAMLQLGWPPAKIKTEAVATTDLNIEDEQGNIIEENYKKLWGDWAGREEEFYIKCFEIVSKVDAETFKRITGIKHEILEAAILDTHKEFLKNVLPEKLKVHPEVISENGEEGYTKLKLGEVSAKIPSVIFPIIRGFNGKRSTVEVFHLGYNVLFNLSEVVDELREKGMLIEA
jgi:Fe-S-cluster containining protein